MKEEILKAKFLLHAKESPFVWALAAMEEYAKLRVQEVSHSDIFHGWITKCNELTEALTASKPAPDTQVGEEKVSPIEIMCILFEGVTGNSYTWDDCIEAINLYKSYNLKTPTMKEQERLKDFLRHWKEAMDKIPPKSQTSPPAPDKWPSDLEGEIRKLLRLTYETEFNPKDLPEMNRVYAVEDTDGFMFTYGDDMVKAISNWIKEITTQK